MVGLGLKHALARTQSPLTYLPSWDVPGTRVLSMLTRRQIAQHVSGTWQALCVCIFPDQLEGARGACQRACICCILRSCSHFALHVCTCVCVLVVSVSVRPHGLEPARLLSPWDSPGKNTGVGCHALLQRIFLTQGSNPGILHCRQILYCLSHQGSP